jgi:diacylglycerol kinase (ATP)
MKKAAVIANPFAGPAQGRLSGLEAVALLQERGFDPELLVTESRGHATELARQAAENHDLVVSVGGDGTVHEVAEGLAGTGCPLGVLPSGSGNDFAMGIDCPDVESGLKAISGGRIMECDTALFDGRFFVNSAGLLASGLVSLKAARLWRWLGRNRYLLASVAVLLSYRGQEVNWAWDEGGEQKNLPGRFLMAEICNGPSTGGGFRFAPDAAFADGALDACLIRPVGLITLARLLGPASRGEALDLEAISLIRSGRIVFTSDQPVGYHLDGEAEMLPAGEHVIEIIPGNLKVLVP